MKNDSLKTQIARIASVRSRSAYRQAKAQLLAELRDARQRGEDPAQFLAQQEAAAIRIELLGRNRS